MDQDKFLLELQEILRQVAYMYLERIHVNSKFSPTFCDCFNYFLHHLCMPEKKIGTS